MAIMVGNVLLVVCSCLWEYGRCGRLGVLIGGHHGCFRRLCVLLGG